MKNKRLSQVRSTPSWLSQRKGWIRVVEAFIAVLLIGTVILLTINQDNGDQDDDISAGVYEDQSLMLNSIRLDDNLRDIIIGIPEASLPLDTNNVEFPSDVKAKLDEKNPGYLTCDAKICLIDEECILENTDSSNIYVSQATIFANLQTYSPRKIVLSCVIVE